MSTTAISSKVASRFQTGEVMTISGGHFTHDTFSAFLAPLLPLLIEKMSLSLTLAGSLTAFMQFPAILNPFIGYLADRMSLRYLVIFAPAVTASLMTLIGLAPNYPMLALLLLVVGVSIAAFHAPAPAMVARISGHQVGKGMSLFMAAGELGRTIGPLIAVWGVSLWRLDGLPRLMAIGWGATLILFWRLHRLPARCEPPCGIGQLIPRLVRLFLPLIGILLLRNFLAAGLAIYLPTFMRLKGHDLVFAGTSLAVWELAGVGGSLASGTLSDRLGRKPILLAAIILSSFLALIFLNTQGAFILPLLILLGFTTLAPGPVMLAIVQENFTKNRAAANGLYLSMAFILRPLTIMATGFLGDHLGLQSAFTFGALIALLAIPLILLLPNPD